MAWRLFSLLLFILRQDLTGSPGLCRSRFETNLRSGWPHTHSIHPASSFWVLGYKYAPPCLGTEFFLALDNIPSLGCALCVYPLICSSWLLPGLGNWVMWYSNQPFMISCGYILSVHLRRCRRAQVLDCMIRLYDKLVLEESAKPLSTYLDVEHALMGLLSTCMPLVCWDLFSHFESYLLIVIF